MGPLLQMFVPWLASLNQTPAAIRHLFDWLVTGQVVPVNPAQTTCRLIAKMARRMTSERRRLSATTDNARFGPEVVDCP